MLQSQLCALSLDAFACEAVRAWGADCFRSFDNAVCSCPLALLDALPSGVSHNIYRDYVTAGGWLAE